MLRRISFVFLLLFSLTSWASITDLKVSTAQIFDVQWSISGNTLYTSGYNYIYASINYTTQTASAARLTSANYADINSVAGRYIGFFASTTNPGTYGMAVFNADGTKYKILNNTGSFRALANGAIFYNGNGSWGTLITTGQGYNLGSSATFTVTTSYPTNTQLQAYTPPSSTPLAAGQTAAPAAPTYSSSITTVQQTSKTARTAARQSQTANEIYIEQAGDNNNITIRQGTSSAGKNRMTVNATGNSNTLNLNQGYLTDGTVSANDFNNHYLYLNANGNSNTITTQQTGNGQYNETTVSGNNNIINLQQMGTGSKTLFTNINGSNNTATVQQKDSGQDYLDLKLTGNGHNVNALQQGSGNHAATIDLTNNGGSSTLYMTQQGTTAQTYSITQSCATPTGCSTTIVQGQ
jgi:hypothetical protein